MSLVAILNPKAQSGNVARTWAEARRHLRGEIQTWETKAPGHAIELARDAIRGGAKKIIAVGGDGTINEVVNGFFENEKPIASDVVLGIIPHGTGSDLRRVLNLPLDETAAAEVIQTGRPWPIDVMKVRYTRMDGAVASRYSINLTSFGLGGAVAARVNRSSKLFGGKVAFILATLQTSIEFRGSSVRLMLDDSKTIEAIITNVAVGNGQYHGGGMWICPRAVLDDGLLDVTVIQYLSLSETVQGLPLLYNGRIYEHPKVLFHRAKRIKAESRDPALIEIDGEPLGQLPIEIEVVPKAIRILTSIM